MSDRYGTLCSGIGGLDLAVESVFGFHPAWHAEVDPTAALVHDHHWPGVPNVGDIKTADWSTVDPVELICAGYPCQPFSAAGARRGEEDDRHLWPYVAEAVRILRPRWVVLENVAGHLSLGFGAVLGDLAEAGYDAEWCCLRASDVGAPHRRERVFVVAQNSAGRGSGSEVVGGQANGPALLRSPGGAGGPAQGVAAHSGRLGAPGRRESRDVASPAGTGQGEGDQWQRDGDALGDSGEDAAHSDSWRLQGGEQPVHARPGEPHVARCASVDPEGIGWWAEGLIGGLGAQERGEDTADTDRSGLQGARVEHSEPLSRVGRERSAGSDLVAADAAGPGRRAHQGRGPRAVQGDQEPERSTVELRRCDSGDTDWGPFEPAIRRWESLLGRRAPAPVDGRGRLAPPFVEWMMGYPLGWVTGDVYGRVKRTAALRCLGNAVVPQQGIAALSVVLEAWEEAA